jgi:epoxyqueuosine reductase
MPEHSASLEALVKAQAFGMGFDLVGITTLGAALTAPRFEHWLDSGFAGEMHYMERGRVKRRDSRLPLPGARSAIVVGLNYGGTQPGGPIARYARGLDYHDVMEKKLRQLLEWLRQTSAEPVTGKAYVDTGPILERELARNAGLGWFGKNTNLINPRLGSFFFIGALLTDLELRPDEPFAADHCGSCTRCMEACPTAAIVEEGSIDARRCISYLTIENRAAIAEELRDSVGELVYGCDICQDVCPWNVKFARDVSLSELEPRRELVRPDLARLLLLSEDDFRSLFARSPVKRAKRTGLARNVAVALGNRSAPGDHDALKAALAREDDPMVREHLIWGISRSQRAETV